METFKEAERIDGHYLLPSNLQAQSLKVPWPQYTQLTHIEAAFKSLKADPQVRPIYHQVQPRVEAHILVAFLGYALLATLAMYTRRQVPGLTARAVLELLAGIQMLDVHLPVTDGRWLVMPRYTVPRPEERLLLDKLELVLPEQPPPKIYPARWLPSPRKWRRPTRICSSDFCPSTPKLPWGFDAEVRRLS